MEALQSGPILEEFLSEPCENSLSNVENLTDHVNYEHVEIVRGDERICKNHASYQSNGVSSSFSVPINVC
mgnify:CR=1 FL=1